MPETFGFRLKRFALAVDIVDDDIFDGMWAVIYDYLAKHFRLAYWALLTEAEVEWKPGLRAIVSELGKGVPSFRLQTDDGRYTGLAAYAFDEGKPLWIVNPDAETLGPSTPVRDAWSDAAALPSFDRPADEGIRTVILVPIREERRKPIGLLDLQSDTHYEFTARAETELLNLAATLAVLMPLRDANNERKKHTLDAIALHRDALVLEHWPVITTPKIFVASSHRADPAVMAEIVKVLARFTGRLTPYYWDRDAQAGHVIANMLKEIQESQFGLCYFSEPDEPGSPFSFRDNPNVVFEAGLLEAMTHSGGNGMGWIPIREQDCPPPPSDFALLRTIRVHRDNGTLNVHALHADLTACLERMLA